MRGFGVYKKGTVGWMDKPDPVCGPRDAIAKPIAIAPCSSDVHSAFESEGDHLINRILGHESLGEIIEVGSEVKDFKVGDRVIVPAVTPTWTHPDIQDSYHQHAGGFCTGINFSSYEDGTFANIFKIRSVDMNVALIPDGMSLEAASMIPDMMTTGFHGAELAEVKFGDTVLVLGIGPVGLMAVAGAKLMGAGKLIAVGSRQNCIDLAKEYGATDIVSYKDGDVLEQVLKLTNGKGVDSTIVAGGDLDTLYSAFAATKPGGIIANLNVFAEAKSFNIPSASILGLVGHQTLKGGLCPGGRKRMERLAAVVQAGRVDPGKMITHKLYGLESIEEAFNLMVNKPKDLIKPLVFFK